MKAKTSDFRPSWWTESTMSSWDRVKDAVRRDWQQTKHDLGVGGHELNQRLADTVRQGIGVEPLPPPSKPNPPKVIGELNDDDEWEEVEPPLRYGHGARGHFLREYPSWSPEVEARLRAEWEARAEPDAGKWEDIRDYVRRGYEFSH